MVGVGNPNFGRSVFVDLSSGVPHDFHKLKVAGVLVCNTTAFRNETLAIQHFFESNEIAMPSEFHMRSFGKKDKATKVDRLVA